MAKKKAASTKEKAGPSKKPNPELKAKKAKIAALQVEVDELEGK